MEYFVRHIVNYPDRRESWALVDRECMPELEDSRLCEENDIKAVASSKAELKLKMALMGLELGGIDNLCRMTSAETWTTWTVGKVEDDG